MRRRAATGLIGEFEPEGYELLWARFLEFIRSGSKRNMWLLVDIMLKSPKRDRFAAVLIARAVNRALMDGEPVYHKIQAHAEEVCQELKMQT